MSSFDRVLERESEGAANSGHPDHVRPFAYFALTDARLQIANTRSASKSP
jgi:hypothetical protein